MPDPTPTPTPEAVEALALKLLNAGFPKIEPTFDPAVREFDMHAVAAERERCAKVAEGFNGAKHAAFDLKTGAFPKQSFMGDAIAAAIREGK